MSGQIPWADIKENPSNHFPGYCWPDTDHRLQEPSHMQSAGVDAWLGHWLCLQTRGKHPLILTTPTNQSSNNNDTSKCKGKQKVKYVKPNRSDKDPTLEDDQDNMPIHTTDSPSRVVNETNTHLSDCANDDNNVGATAGAESTKQDDRTKYLEVIPEGKVLPASPHSAAKSQGTWFAFLKSLSDNGQYQELLALLRKVKVRTFVPQYTSSECN